MNKPFFRRILSLVLAMTTLWVCIVTAGSQTLSSAVAAMHASSVPKCCASAAAATSPTLRMPNE